jgi:hypothetical protein
MSYLLEALKESQQRRDEGRGDPLFPDKAIDSSRSENGNSGNSRKYLYLATLAVALGVVGGWVYSVKEEAPGGDELPAFTQSADVSSVEVALAEVDTASARVEAVASEQPDVNDKVLLPIQKEAIAESRDLDGTDGIDESKDTGQVAGAGEVVARDVAAVSGPVANPNEVPPHLVTSPLRDPSVEERPKEEPGGEESPDITQPADVSVVEVALAEADTASVRIEAVESEQPEVNDKALSPIQEEAIAKIRDLYESDGINESKDTGQVAGAGEVVARDVAAVSGPVTNPNEVPPQRVTSPVRDPSVEESTMDESVDSSIPHLKTLPLEIQQEIGPMVFSVHIYSRKIPKRFVTINGTKSRDGDRLKNGVLLESIVSSGAIFTYKGYRFWIPLG